MHIRMALAGPCCALDRNTYGIDYDQEEELFIRDFPDLAKKGPGEETYTTHSPLGFGKSYVRDRFEPLVYRGDLMARDQKAQAREEYTCVHDEVYVRLFETCKDKAVFVTGLWRVPILAALLRLMSCLLCGLLARDTCLLPATHASCLASCVVCLPATHASCPRHTPPVLPPVWSACPRSPTPGPGVLL